MKKLSRRLRLRRRLLLVVEALVLCSTFLVAFARGAADDQRHEPGSTLGIRKVEASGVNLYKMPSPLPEEQPVEDGFPGVLPAQFIREAFHIDAPTSPGGVKILNNTSCSSEQDSSNTCSHKMLSNLDELFGAAILETAKHIFDDRGLRHELDEFLKTGTSDPSAGPRRMHWVGIEILPNQSLALHSHPNIEFAYIVEGVMHEWRIVDESIEKKKVYVPEQVDVNGTTQLKYHGPDFLAEMDAGQEGMFRHNQYSAGEMFINAIGDVHQSFTSDEGVKLFVMWGDGNADIPEDKYPYNSGFLNVQSAKAWD